jgi:hypothetical protein
LGWEDAWNRNCSTELKQTNTILICGLPKLQSRPNAHLRVNIRELRKVSILSIGKELCNGFDIGSLLLNLGPPVELSVWIETGVKVVDPSDTILIKLLEN